MSKKNPVTFEMHDILKTRSVSLCMCYRSLKTKSDIQYSGTFSQCFRSLLGKRNRCHFPKRGITLWHLYCFQSCASLLWAELRYCGKAKHYALQMYTMSGKWGGQKKWDELQVITISFKRLQKMQVLCKLQFFMGSYVGKKGKKALVFAKLGQTRQTGLYPCR